MLIEDFRKSLDSGIRSLRMRWFWRGTFGFASALSCWMAGNVAAAEAVPEAPAQELPVRTAVAPNLPDPIPAGEFELKQGDVVAFVGGGDIASAQRTGHLEALLAASYGGLGVRFRNFGWEGDTASEQPREVGFPTLTEHLVRSGATVIMIEYGRNEALEGPAGLPDFMSSYHRLIEQFGEVTSRLVLMTPPPFENGGGHLPDLSQRNADLEQYSVIIRAIALQRKLPVIDLFAEFGGKSHSALQLTQDGLQITAPGHGLLAAAVVRQLGFSNMASLAGVTSATGVWPVENLEKLRLAVVEKNRLWFHYWRPQNWAFLGGDRTSQPSSRDHLDPSVRWFPEEMREFVPLIEAKEAEIAELASQVKP